MNAPLFDTVRHLRNGSFLADCPAIDWEQSLDRLHRRNVAVLERLCGDKALFRSLILGAREDPYLWSKCEEDVVEDKIVLWDDMTKGIRIRLRMAIAPQQRLAHCHRFSFTNLVLAGQYIHWMYRPLEAFDELTNLDDVETVGQRVDRAGDAFTIHHETLHSTPFSGVGTVSLVLRGNPVKARAPVMFKEARGRAEQLEKMRSDGAQSARGNTEEPRQARVGDFFWRVGEESESKERRAERQMRTERVDYWIKELGRLGIL